MDIKIDEFKTLFSQDATAEALLPAYAQLLSDKEGSGSLVLSMLEEAAAAPALLKDEAQRRLVGNLFLLCGMLGLKAAWKPVLALVSAPEFDREADHDSWLFSDLSRLFGTIAPEQAMTVIKELVLKGGLPAAVREQLILATIFRWFAEQENDRDFAAVMRELLERIPAGEVNFELGTALIVSGIAAGGESMRGCVEGFYRANSAVFGTQLPERNLKNFFDLGRQRIKSMLRSNYLGVYGKPEDEIRRMLCFHAEAESAAAANRSLPPIVRDRPKIGRNEPCPCGSGKKYKHCCGR